MATITMPQLGESVTEGTVIKWLKQPGDPVALDESLCEIETEKVTAELPSPYEGTMGAIHVPEGETVEVGAPLCDFDEGKVGAHAAIAAKTGAWSGGPMAIPPDEISVPAAGNGASRAPLARAGRDMPAVSRPGRQPDARERFYSPAVMRLAAEHQLDLADVSGTGIGGRVTRKDVEAVIAAGPARGAEAPARSAAPSPATGRRPAATPVSTEGQFEVVQLSATRRTIAENLKRSNLEAPQAWTMVEVDVTGLVALRARERALAAERDGVDLTLLPYFTAAVCETLREFPALNARWEGDELHQYHTLDIGIAIAAEGGLVVPVVHNAGDLSVVGLAKAIADLVERAHARKLRLEDIEGGTFTVNNTGSFGSIASKPIVNYPQVAIVSMERAVKRPVVVGGDAIAVRSMMNVCLSFDHRVADGLEAGGFLAALKRRLEAAS